jgi:hypothetical protein
VYIKESVKIIHEALYYKCFSPNIISVPESEKIKFGILPYRIGYFCVMITAYK